MKKTVLVLSMLCFAGASMFSQVSGELTVSVKTSQVGGKYAPKNVVAIWVEDGTAKFVKTLLANANSRKTHLNTWEASTTTAGSAFNKVDAISGATRSNHNTTLTCKWNGKDYKGNLVADGNYRLRMELTNKNSTGNIALFQFTKDKNGFVTTAPNVPSFSNIQLK